MDFGERNKSCLITDYFSLTKKNNLFVKGNEIWGHLLSGLTTLCIVRFHSQCSVHDRRQLYNLFSNPYFTDGSIFWDNLLKDITSFWIRHVFLHFFIIEASECDQLSDKVRKTNLLARMNKHFYFLGDCCFVHFVGVMEEKMQWVKKEIKYGI